MCSIFIKTVQERFDSTLLSFFYVICSVVKQMSHHVSEVAFTPALFSPVESYSGAPWLGSFSWCERRLRPLVWTSGLDQTTGLWPSSYTGLSPFASELWYFWLIPGVNPYCINHINLTCGSG